MTKTTTVSIPKDVFKKVEAYWGNEFLMIWYKGKQAIPFSDQYFSFSKRNAEKIHIMIAQALETKRIQVDEN